MSRLICFTANAWGDYTHWQHQYRKTLKRLNMPIEAAVRELFSGIGKP